MRSIFIRISFLQPFAENLKAFLQIEEITSLLEIYQSSLMQKMLKHSEELFAPLYEAYEKKSRRIIGKSFLLLSLNIPE